MDTAAEVRAELERLRQAVRKHRDERGDDRCWMDNETLYRMLPEGYTPPDRDELVELQNCVRYIASCHRPGVEYVSPQRRIDELEAENAKLREAFEAWRVAYHRASAELRRLKDGC